jgi:hypothetical protein
MLPRLRRDLLMSGWQSRRRDGEERQTAEAAEDRGGLRMRDINQISSDHRRRHAQADGQQPKLEPSASLRALRGDADD